MNQNTDRYDLSNWLIHFFRKIELENNKNAPIIPEHFGFGNFNESGCFSPFFMLRCAIRLGRIWATWSFRRNIRTIYGPHPAICFTEMPIAAFLEASHIRSKKAEAISQYGFIFPKKELFRLGANPVIYGLDKRNTIIPDGKDGNKRLISPEILPLNEQYRYITYNPISSKPIDWTHEREWRWAFRDEEILEKYEHEIKNGFMISLDDIPYLDIYDLINSNNIGLIVDNKKEAKLIIHDIIMLIDRNIIPKDFYKFILCSSDLKSKKNIFFPNEINDAIKEAMFDISIYMDIDKSKSSGICSTFSKIVKDIDNSFDVIEEGEFGGCWLWLLDNTHLLTRYLILDERITINNDGRYLVNLYEFNDSRGLRQREKMTKKLADKINEIYKIECGYFSVLNSDDFNGFPFYCEDLLENSIFYNK